MKRLLFILMLILTGFLVSCNYEFEYRVHVEIRGTGDVVEKALVTIDGAGASKNALTDDLGNAVIFIDDSLACKPGKLSVTADGYDPYTLQIDLCEENLPTDVPLTPKTFEYEVHVGVQESDTPISNATVSIRPDGGGVSASGDTDDNGIVTIVVDASLVGKIGKLVVEADGFESYTENIRIVEGELPSFVRLILLDGPPPEPLIVADFDSCAGTNDLGGAMGAAYESPDLLEETYVQESGRGCVARLEFDIEAWAAFWMRLQGADLSPYSSLTFDIRAEANPNIPDQVKIELKRVGDQIGIVYVSEISNDWQTVRVNLSDFGPAGFGNPLSSFTGMNELVFTFESARSGDQGVLYLDNVTANP